MTRTGDREIGVVSGRLPDNLGGLACMLLVSLTIDPVENITNQLLKEQKLKSPVKFLLLSL